MLQTRREWRNFYKPTVVEVGDHMAQWNGLIKALSVILPAGAVGASVLLALASSDALAASTQSSNAAPPSGESVSTRLQEIRTGISDMTGSATDPAQGGAKAEPAWWGNGGWGRWRLGWGNGGGGWHNGGWGNGGWHNGGWGNGGWGNGGWHNGWHNFWHNW
jgi:rSAM-associated Gly-rich repeat protein